MTRTLRVATYNIHRCIGRDGRRDPARIADVLNAMNVDLAALQEVDTSLDPTTELGQLQVLAERTGLVPVTGPTIEKEGGFYGNALLARHQPDHVELLDLSILARERRGALQATFDWDDLTMRVTATHLGLKAPERRQQIERVVAALTPLRADLELVLGDFNEWFPFSRNLRHLRRAFGRTDSPRTFPSSRPILSLDRIWAIPETTFQNVDVWATPTARLASDHLPVVADLRLPE